MQFEYYVLNYNPNAKKIEPFNIFRNCYVQEYTEKAIKKYLRSPKNYKYEKYGEDTLYGFEGLCKEIERIIQWQEWSRCEYEIAVGAAFEKDCNKLEKWDCYGQCVANIPMITREVIWQYKQQLKGEKDESIKE